MSLKTDIHSRASENAIIRAERRIERFYLTVVPFDLAPHFKGFMKHMMPTLFEDVVRARKRFLEDPCVENADEWERLSKRLILKCMFKHKRIA